MGNITYKFAIYELVSESDIMYQKLNYSKNFDRSRKKKQFHSNIYGLSCFQDSFDIYTELGNPSYFFDRMKFAWTRPVTPNVSITEIGEYAAEVELMIPENDGDIKDIRVYLLDKSDTQGV